MKVRSNSQFHAWLSVNVAVSRVSIKISAAMIRSREPDHTDLRRPQDRVHVHRRRHRSRDQHCALEIASPHPRRHASRMVRLFRKSEEKIAQQAAAQGEIDRLKTLSVEELAVMVLTGLGPEETPTGHNLRPQQLCEYLLRDFPRHGQ